MDLMHMIGETSLMMGFTFIVGMAFAYVLKLMTFFFSRLNGTEISALLRKGRIWGRAYRMDIARTDRYIRSVARIGGDVSADPDADHAMDALAEYHLGTPGDAARPVSYTHLRAHTAGRRDDPFIRTAPWNGLILAIFSRESRPCCKPIPRSCMRVSG